MICIYWTMSSSMERRQPDHDEWSFCVFLNGVYKYFTENFCVCVQQGDWPVILSLSDFVIGVVLAFKQVLESILSFFPLRCWIKICQFYYIFQRTNFFPSILCSIIYSISLHLSFGLTLTQLTFWGLWGLSLRWLGTRKRINKLDFF